MRPSPSEQVQPGSLSQDGRRWTRVWGMLGRLLGVRESHLGWGSGDLQASSLWPIGVHTQATHVCLQVSTPLHKCSHTTPQVLPHQHRCPHHPQVLPHTTNRCSHTIHISLRGAPRPPTRDPTRGHHPFPEAEPQPQSL